MKNPSYDIQALQMEEIARIASEEPQKLLDYISNAIFTSLINILEKDTTNLEKPTEKQTEARKKIIINELVKKDAEIKNIPAESIELPYEISEDDFELATNLTSMEQAERNKEYALYTIAMLSKAYAEDMKEKEGHNIPITDLPGITNIVNVFKNEKNPSIKVAAIDALMYCRKPEYDEEIKSVLLMASNDKNQMVAESARGGLMILSSVNS